MKNRMKNPLLHLVSLLRRSLYLPSKYRKANIGNKFDLYSKKAFKQIEAEWFWHNSSISNIYLKVPWCSQFESFSLPFQWSFSLPFRFPCKQILRWNASHLWQVISFDDDTSNKHFWHHFQKFVSSYLLFIGRTRTATFTEAILCRLCWCECC